MGMVVGPVALVLLGILLVLLISAYRPATWDDNVRQAISDELDRRGWWSGHLDVTDNRRARVAQLCGGEPPDSTDRVRAAEALIVRNAGLDAAGLTRRRDEASALALARFSVRSRRIGDLDMLLRAWPYMRAVTQGELAWAVLKELGRPVLATLAQRFARHLGHLTAAAGVLAVLVWPWVQNVGGSAVPRWQEFVGALVNLAVGAAMLWTLTAEMRSIATPVGVTISRWTVAAAWLLMLGLPVVVATGIAEQALRAVSTYLAEQVERLDAQGHVALGGAVMAAICLYTTGRHFRWALHRRDLVKRVESLALAVSGTSLAVAVLAATLGWPRPLLLSATYGFAASVVTVGITDLASRTRAFHRTVRALHDFGHPQRPARWQLVVWASTALSTAPLTLAGMVSPLPTGAWAILAPTLALLSLPCALLLGPLAIASVVAAAQFARRTRLRYEALVGVPGPATFPGVANL